MMIMMCLIGVAVELWAETKKFEGELSRKQARTRKSQRTVNF